MVNHVFNAFTSSEDAMIIAASTDCMEKQWTFLAKKLNREEYVVIQRAFQLGVVKFADVNHIVISHRSDGWRSDELDFLIENAGKMSVRNLAAKLGRTESSIAKQIYEFKLSYNQDASWKEDELNKLKKITEKGAAYVAKETGRCLIDVKHQAIKQGYWKHGLCLTQFPGRGGALRFSQGVA